MKTGFASDVGRAPLDEAVFISQFLNSSTSQFLNSSMRNPLVTLGTGAGIEIRGDDLSVALVKSRWKGVTVAGTTLLRDFRRRPASEWGLEYRQFLKSHQFRDWPAMLALPREEAIVRLLALPAVSRSELKAAVQYQVDGLHPYGEDSVYYSFAALERRAEAPAEARVELAVVIAAKEVVDRYADLFLEAGVKLRGITVAAAGYYGAPRLLRGRPPEAFLVADQHNSAFELYGESAARRFFTAAFDSRLMPLEKALAAAAAELRIEEPDPGQAVPLLVCGDRTVQSPLAPEQVLGSPLRAPQEFDLARDAAAFVTALAGACPRWGWRTNLLPASRRSSSARWPMALTAAAAVAVLLVALVLWLRAPLQDRRYARELDREIKRLEAVEREVRGLERQAEKVRSRRAQLEGFRRRPEADLALLTEISRRLPATVWLSNIEIAEDSVQLVGQADAAAPLLGLVDTSGMLTGASFTGSIQRSEHKEVFRMKAARRLQALPAPAPPAASPAQAVPAVHHPVP